MVFYMRSFADELTKLSQVSQLSRLSRTGGKAMDFLRGRAVPAAREHGGKAALVAGGGLGALGIKRLAEDISFAEKARSQGYGV